MDLGIAIRSSLCRFTVFGACTYDMVLQGITRVIFKLN